MSTILEFKNVSVGYDKKNNIVNDFSTNIEKGSFVSILGQNGSGKSTILKSIFGLADVNQGEIIYDGIRVNKLFKSEKDSKKEIKVYKKKELAQKVAFVPQIASFPTDITVKEFVEMGRFPYGSLFTRNKTLDDEIVIQSLKDVDLLEYKDHYICELSGGQQQRALIALALSQETETIVLDEPTNHLDIKMQLEIMYKLHELNHKTNKTIIVVVHDINHGLRFSDKVIIMKDGKKLIEGKTNDIINEKNIEQAFGVKPKLMNSDGQKLIYDYWVEGLSKVSQTHKTKNK